MNEVQAAAALRGSFHESVLLEINEHGGGMDHEDLEAFTGGARESAEALEALHGQGLVETPDYEGGRLTPFGTRTANLIKRSLLSGPRRADAVQRAVLSWLTGHSPAGSVSSVEEFVGQSDAIASGQPITEVEVHQAAELLRDRGYIKALATFAGSQFLRPEITADGRAALMSDVLISEYGTPNATMISNDYSNRVSFGNQANAGGVIVGGQGHHQNVVQTIGPAKRTELAEKVSDLLSLVEQLPEGTEGADQLRGVLQELSGEVSLPEPRQPVVQEAVVKAIGAAANLLGTAVGQQLLEGLAQLAKMLTG